MRYAFEIAKNQGLSTNYYALLNNLRPQGVVSEIVEESNSHGDAHRMMWTSVITIYLPANPSRGIQFLGSGSRKQDARNLACAQALEYLGRPI